MGGKEKNLKLLFLLSSLLGKCKAQLMVGKVQIIIMSYHMVQVCIKSVEYCFKHLPSTHRVEAMDLEQYVLGKIKNKLQNRKVSPPRKQTHYYNNRGLCYIKKFWDTSEMLADWEVKMMLLIAIMWHKTPLIACE